MKAKSPGGDLPPDGCCDGCGQGLMYAADTELGPRLRLRLCKARGSTHLASMSCLLAALKRRPPTCPGCGANVKYPAALCAQCSTDIQRGRAEAERLFANPDAPPCLVLVDAALFNPDAHEFHNYEDEGRLTEALRTLVRGERWDRNHRAPSGIAVVDGGAERKMPSASRGFLAPLSAAQVEAMRTLLASVRSRIGSAARHGYERGNNVLRRLAAGDMGVLAFEEAERENRDGRR